MAAPSADSDISSAMSSNDTEDTEEDGPPRKLRRTKKKPSINYWNSESDSSGSYLPPKYSYENIPEKNDTVVLWNYQNYSTAFRRNIEGAENTFYNIIPAQLHFQEVPCMSEANPIFHLPEEILQSIEYRAAYHMIKQDLSPLQFNTRSSHWESRDLPRELGYDEVKAALGLGGEDNHYTRFLHSMARDRTHFSESFLKGFKKSEGWTCLFHLMDYGKHFNCFEQPGLYMTAKKVGGASPGDGSSQIFVTDFTEQGFRWRAGSAGKDELSRLYDMTKNNSCSLRTRVPDAQVVLNQGSEQNVIITGVVQPSLRGSYLEDVLQQTWEQSLIGLIRKDVTYGILISQTSAWLLEIALDHEKRQVHTTKEVFEFFQRTSSPGHVPFNTESFLNLFQCIVGILYQQRPSS